MIKNTWKIGKRITKKRPKNNLELTKKFLKGQFLPKFIKKLSLNQEND